MTDDPTRPTLEERFTAHAELMRGEVRRQRADLATIHADLIGRMDDLHLALDAGLAVVMERLEQIARRLDNGGTP